MREPIPVVPCSLLIRLVFNSNEMSPNYDDYRGYQDEGKQFRFSELQQGPQTGPDGKRPRNQNCDLFAPAKKAFRVQIKPPARRSQMFGR